MEKRFFPPSFKRKYFHLCGHTTENDLTSKKVLDGISWSGEIRCRGRKPCLQESLSPRCPDLLQSQSIFCASITKPPSVFCYAQSWNPASQFNRWWGPVCRLAQMDFKLLGEEYPPQLTLQDSFLLGKKLRTTQNPFSFTLCPSYLSLSTPDVFSQLQAHAHSFFPWFLFGWVLK